MRYYPSEIVFPLGYLIDALEKVSHEMRTAAPDWEPGCIVRAMTEIGVSFPLLFEIYNHVFDSKVTQIKGSILILWSPPTGFNQMPKCTFWVLFVRYSIVGPNLFCRIMLPIMIANNSNQSEWTSHWTNTSRSCNLLRLEMLYNWQTASAL